MEDSVEIQVVVLVLEIQEALLVVVGLDNHHLVVVVLVQVLGQLRQDLVILEVRITKI